MARAFDQVHAEAVRLAGTEAQLRSNLNAMFISLSRRSVPLIDRLSRMIDNFEQNEDDPDQLSHLFSMDHLVTRMRRNSENLLVLAGEEPVRKWSEPVPLTDVARAAAAEIEQYGRVALTVQPGIMVSGQSAADVVHLLAELLENATLFSPRNTQVQVAAADAPGGGVLIEIRDEGVGVSTSRLAEMNWRLDHPPGVDVSVSRHMGLFAVSRLAARRGIRVRLRAGAPQGLTALVWLPGTLTSREQPPTVGMHSRPIIDSPGLAEEMAFAEALPRRRTCCNGRPAGSAGGTASDCSPPTASSPPRGSRIRRRNGTGTPPAAMATPRRATSTPPRTAGTRPRAAGIRAGRRVPRGRQRLRRHPRRVCRSGRRAAPAAQPERRSVWFAAKTPVLRSGQGRATRRQHHRRQETTGGSRPPPTGAAAGRLTAGAHYTGAYSAELAARAAGDGQGIGRRSRRPGPGSRCGCRRRPPGSAGQPPRRLPVRCAPTRRPSSARRRVTGAQGPGRRSPRAGAQRQVAPQAPRRRSPEAARNRLAGFQLGSRDAAQTGNGGWSAFSRDEELPARETDPAYGGQLPPGPPYPPSQPR